MTKYQIFAPNGAKVCIIEAESKVTTNERTLFYKSVKTDTYFADFNYPLDICVDIPLGWAAIPI